MGILQDLASGLGYGDVPDPGSYTAPSVPDPTPSVPDYSIPSTADLAAQGFGSPSGGGVGAPSLSSSDTSAIYSDPGYQASTPAEKSFIDSLMSQLGDKAKKDPLSALATIVGAVGTLKNLGQSSYGGQQAMAKLSALVNTPQPYNAANTIVAKSTPVYHPANQFIVNAPSPVGGGALTQISTGSK